MADRENQAAEFLEFLQHNIEERDRLENAVLAEIVEAGKAKGFHFTEKDLRHAPQPFAVLRSAWHAN